MTMSVLGLVAGIVYLTAPARATEADGQSTPDPSDYVGAQACDECHSSKFEQFSATSHSRLVTDPHVPVGDRGCEACHGPGAEHTKLAKDLNERLSKPGGANTPQPTDWKIFNPKKASAEEVADRCTRCHTEQSIRRQHDHVEHDPKAVSCNDCHSPHQARTNPYLLIDDPPNLCFRCHADVKSDFRRPYHHKVIEGGLTCLSCHSGHGEQNTVEARRSPEGLSGLCGRCHEDKRGPWAFEHLGLTRSGEGCLTCHTPHGSVNNRLLVRNTVFQLCIECHSEIGLSADTSRGIFPHDLGNPRFRTCTNCHTQIHGSNAHEKFLY
jgi:DmsE family decaheme c-type cytochrome